MFPKNTGVLRVGKQLSLSKGDSLSIIKNIIAETTFGTSCTADQIAFPVLGDLGAMVTPYEKLQLLSHREPD